MDNTEQTRSAHTESRVVLGELHRIRQGRERRFLAKEPAKVVHVPPRPVKVAVLLALAYRVQREIDAGGLRDRAEAARRCGISRARITQILDLTMLAPSIQEAVLKAQTIEGRERVTERSLRDLLKYDSWALQEVAWSAMGNVP